MDRHVQVTIVSAALPNPTVYMFYSVGHFVTQVLGFCEELMDREYVFN